MSQNEIFLLAMLLVFVLPYLVWRIGRTDDFAPLVVVQILSGIALGPGVAGQYFPEFYQTIFQPSVMRALDGIAIWAVMLFVMLAGIELNLSGVWTYRRESSITAGLALGMPLLTGALAGLLLLSMPGWRGAHASDWQFVLGIGMACAVTALPILILLMEKLGILRLEFGQRILRYASLDDVLIWGVLAVILMDWNRVGRQAVFLLGFALAARMYRSLIVRLNEKDRYATTLIWLLSCSFGADWSGLHFMVGAFLSGTVLETEWFSRSKLDLFREHVLMVLMPVFFLNTGLKTSWAIGGGLVFVAAGILLLAATGGKFAGVSMAGKILGWRPGEASAIAWLLQTKALIMIIFSNVLLEKGIISSATFTALLLMAVASTMLTVPAVRPLLSRLRILPPQTPVPLAMFPEAGYDRSSEGQERQVQEY